MPNKNKKRNLFFAYKKFITSFKYALVLTGVFLLPQAISSSSINTDSIIKYTNAERGKIQLSSLEINPVLSAAARDKAVAILNNQKFQHNIDGKKFSSWIANAGYRYKMVGENLAIDFNDERKILNAWLTSDNHKKNILNPQFSEIGVAAISGNYQGKETTVVVQLFGKPDANSYLISKK